MLVNSTASGPNLLVAFKESVVEAQTHVRELAERAGDSNGSKVSQVASK